MARPVLIAAIALCGCHPSHAPSSATAMTNGAEPSPLPPDDARDFLKGDLVQLPHHGDIRWNGVPVDTEMLKGYLRQVAHLPAGADGVVVEIEPGAAPARAAWMRRQVIDSGLCRQHRCTEARWHEKRPVVY